MPWPETIGDETVSQRIKNWEEKAVWVSIDINRLIQSFYDYI